MKPSTPLAGGTRRGHLVSLLQVGVCRQQRITQVLMSDDRPVGRSIDHLVDNPLPPSASSPRAGTSPEPSGTFPSVAMASA